MQGGTLPFAKRKGDAERSERRGMPAPLIPALSYVIPAKAGIQRGAGQ